MNNNREGIVSRNEYRLPTVIIESIENHCYSNSIAVAIQKMKNKNYINYDKDRDSEVLIFNYVSEYLKNMFPSIFENQTPQENLDIIYKAIEEFLYQRKRENQIPRIINKLKKINSIENKNTLSIKREKAKTIEKVFSLFM